MNDEIFDFLIFIGRFQPFHKGHLAVIEAGLQQSEQLIVLCGSAHQPRSVRNPWTAAEREAMIRGAVATAHQPRIHIAALMDNIYNNEAWVKNVQAAVNHLVTTHYGLPHKQPRIGLIGHDRDHSAYYPNLFPQWDSVRVNNCQGISATPIREAILGKKTAGDYAQALPPNVNMDIAAFCNTEAYAMIKHEREFIREYKQSWSAAPYAPTFVTVDAVIVQSGHLLMVERKERPGKGLLALPGGFVEQNEKLADACLRELDEETRLKVPKPVLKGSIKGQQVFDDPYRSARGRTITHAFYIELAAHKDLPKVKGGDDASRAMWLPLADLDPAQIFEDHYFIIQQMTGL